MLFGASGMDPTTRREREKAVKASDTPANYDTLISFLQTTIDTLKTMESSRSSTRRSESTGKGGRDRSGISNVLLTTRDQDVCQVCNGNHAIDHCHNCRQRTALQRFHLVAQARPCYNCLRKGHSARVCTSQGRCRQCQQRHHSLLHLESHEKRKSNSQHFEGPTAKKPRSTAPDAAMPSLDENSRA